MIWAKRLTPVFLFGVVFGLVVWQVEPPKAITDITLKQASLFFLPLFLLLAFAFNLYFHLLLKSFTLSLGVVMLLVLKSLDSLNLAGGVITAIATLLIARSFKKPGNYQPKIPKLSRLQKQR